MEDGKIYENQKFDFPFVRINKCIFTNCEFSNCDGAIFSNCVLCDCKVNSAVYYDSCVLTTNNPIEEDETIMMEE